MSLERVSLSGAHVSVSVAQSIIDLLIPGQSPGIKERLVDLYGKPEILFFGPDGAFRLQFVLSRLLTRLVLAEGTADVMDWAACEYRRPL